MIDTNKMVGMALAKLLIEKGVFTFDEYKQAITDYVREQTKSDAAADLIIGQIL